jgi:hypothetical protein
MTKSDVAQLGCRMIAVYLLVTAVQEIPEMISNMGAFLGPQGRTALFGLLAGLVIQTLFAILLWVLSGRIGGIISPSGDSEPPVTRLKLHDGTIAGVVAVAAYFAATGIPRIVQFIADVVILSPQVSNGWHGVLDLGSMQIEKAHAVQAVAEVLAAGALVYWCRDIADFVDRPRVRQKPQGGGNQDDQA